MEIYDLSDFLRLSAVLNYQLTAGDLGRRNILNMILQQKPFPDEQRNVLLDLLEYLDQAYGARRRRLGPMAVLHPIRATAIMSRAQGEPCFLDLLTILLHDKLEDLTLEAMGEEEWQRCDEQYQEILERINPALRDQLEERLELLTRQETGETYYEYIGALLDVPMNQRELVRVKLADRLDNTMDMRIDIQDPLEGVNFFEAIFLNLFVNSYQGYRPGSEHPSRAPLNGVKRLYQLFKNTVLATLIRRRRLAEDDQTAQRLFDALVHSSMREAQRIVLHIFGYHLTDVDEQKAIIMDAMKYCQSGRITQVTHPTDPHALDGLFMMRFDLLDPEHRKRELEELYADKATMVQAALAFVAIFEGFLNHPEFYVHGVSEAGIRHDLD